jgi:hypothetical protein
MVYGLYSGVDSERLLVRGLGVGLGLGMDCTVDSGLYSGLWIVDCGLWIKQQIGQEWRRS